jgi:hypothetical protein
MRFSFFFSKRRQILFFARIPPLRAKDTIHIIL